MSSLVIAPLTASDLPAARALLTAALPHDPHVAVVAEEKLFGGNGARQPLALTLGAFQDGALRGVLALAGRWIKLLAVAPEHRQKGVGRALFAAASVHRSATQPERRLRYGDHPGNYLGPGLDERDSEGHAFLKALGLREVARVLNLRAPVRDNPLVTPERAAELAGRAAASGYRVARATLGEALTLLAMISARFSPVWAYEVERALGVDHPLPEGPGVHVAYDAEGAPVAFAAHDGNNRGLGWFGPMGTLPAHRGKGLGEALLLPCLLDVRDRPDGGVIAWVGPVEFYRRACGALADRQFVIYEE